MSNYPSRAWIDALSARAEKIEVPAELSLTIEHRLTDVDVVWHLEIGDGGLHVGHGPHEEPTLTLSSNSATAEAIGRGDLSAQRAFLDGELRVGGDITALLDNRAALDAVAASLAAT